MSIKDGLLDKLQDIINDLEEQGFLIQVTGVEVAALREQHCDICRLVTIQNMMQSQALSLLKKYKDITDAGSH